MSGAADRHLEVLVVKLTYLRWHGDRLGNHREQIVGYGKERATLSDSAHANAQGAQR